MRKYIEKAKVLIEALPYIKEFYGKIVVIKYGGSTMNDELIQEAIIQDIILMKLVGIRPVIVHGGGPEISKVLQKMGKQSEFRNGLRVTDEETMEIVEMVLSGKINKGIVNQIQSQGVNAVGISGKDGKTLLAKKINPDHEDIGFVGEVIQVNPSLLDILIESDFIPVIAPIGTDEGGSMYNINADYAAVAIAGALEAQKLVFLTDVDGVRKDLNDPSSCISELLIQDVAGYIKDSMISGGMIPKIECCVEAVEKGVKCVHILDGRVEHSLILEIFTKKGIGTMIKE